MVGDASGPQGSASDAALVGTWAQTLWKECERTLGPETCPSCVLVGTGPGASKSHWPCCAGTSLPHFTNEKIEVQRGEVTCLRLHSK